MTLTLTGTNSTVTLVDPKTIGINTVKNISNIVLSDGNETIIDRERANDGIILGGTQTSDGYTKMYNLNGIMDDDNFVTVSGLPDTNMNTDYRIGNLRHSASIGYPTGMYDWELTLERMRD